MLVKVYIIILALSIASFGFLLLSDALKKRRRSYRNKYRQTVRYLNNSTAMCNNLALKVLKTKDLKLIDYYSGTLSVLESLLLSVLRLKPFGSSNDTLSGALFLSKDCYHRCRRVETAVKEFNSRGNVDHQTLYSQFKPGGLNKIGCYFCSRPYEASFFGLSRVRIHKQYLEVISCKICQQELKRTKKVKVLSFVQDGKPVHWSEVKDYSPSKEYWGLNLDQRKNKQYREHSHLELIHSQQLPLE